MDICGFLAINRKEIINRQIAGLHQSIQRIKLFYDQLRRIKKIDIEQPTFYRVRNQANKLINVTRRLSIL